MAILRTSVRIVLQQRVTHEPPPTLVGSRRLGRAKEGKKERKRKQGKEFKENKVENCAWSPVVDENMLKFLECIEHKSGWYPFENGHAQVAYRAKALRSK